MLQHHVLIIGVGSIGHRHLRCFQTTGRARLAIRRATRTAVRTQYAALGRRIVERLCQRAKREYYDEKLTGALPPAWWTRASDTLILHGRRICKPVPLCERCAANDACDYRRRSSRPARAKAGGTAAGRSSSAKPARKPPAPRRS